MGGLGHLVHFLFRHDQLGGLQGEPNRAPPSHRLTALSPLAPEGAVAAGLNTAKNVGYKLLCANRCTHDAHKRATSFCELVKIGKAHPESVHKQIAGNSPGFRTKKQLRHVQGKDVVLRNAVTALLTAKKHGEAAGSGGARCDSAHVNSSKTRRAARLQVAQGLACRAALARRSGAEHKWHLPKAHNGGETR